MNQEDKKDYIRFLDGDLTGFEHLVIRYKDHLIYFLNQYLHNLDTSEDLAQDAFVEILIHKERFQIDMNFKTYLFTIARHKAIDYIRKNRKIRSVIDIPEPSLTYEIEDFFIKEEEKLELAKAIKGLKTEYQKAILLVDIEELPYKDAAKILGKTVPQFRVLLHRARKSLQTALSNT
ncbi:MAG: RNA polymerase sigma factor [Lachnospiraceae bacterium]